MLLGPLSFIGFNGFCAKICAEFAKSSKPKMVKNDAFSFKENEVL
jgi:hypothetical protein